MHNHASVSLSFLVSLCIHSCSMRLIHLNGLHLYYDSSSNWLTVIVGLSSWTLELFSLPFMNISLLAVLHHGSNVCCMSLIFHSVSISLVLEQLIYQLITFLFLVCIIDHEEGSCVQVIECKVANCLNCRSSMNLMHGNQMKRTFLKESQRTICSWG